MAKYKKINIDLYKRTLIIFCGNHKEFKDWIYDYYEDDKGYKELVNVVLHSDDNAQASFWFNAITGDNIIELKDFPETPSQIACMAHECLHATIKILDYVGVKFEQGESNEAYTYLLEYIMYHLLDKYSYTKY